MRNPNGYNVRKLSGKRRKPYNARILLGYDVDDGKMTANPKYKSLGYYASRKDALEAIAKYRLSPQEEPAQTMTLKEVYDAWCGVKFATISASVRSSYTNAFRYFSPLQNRPFSSLRAVDYESVINEDTVPRTVRHFCNVVLRSLYKYALKYDIVEKDYSAVVDFKVDNEVHEERVLFSSSEILALYQNRNTMLHNIVLLGIFTGMRPSEIEKMKFSDIDMESRIIIGGVKTAAGKNRHIPIHKDLLPVMTDIISDNASASANRIVLCGKPLTLWKYRQEIKSIAPLHTPYDTRHTFITACKEQGMDNFVLKRIVGHSVGDVTEKHYTHRDDNFLVSSIDKIDFLSETYL